MDFLNNKIIPLEVETEVLHCEKSMNGFHVVIEFPKYKTGKKGKLTISVLYPILPVSIKDKPKVNEVKYINNFFDLPEFRAMSEVFSTVKKENTFKIGRKEFHDTLIEKVSQGEKEKNYKDKQFQLVYIFDGSDWVPFPLVYNGIAKEASLKEKGIFNITELLSSNGWLNKSEMTGYMFKDVYSRFAL